MSDKFCPAGKCECEQYVDGECCANLIFSQSERHYFEIDIKESEIEVCPWPSRQVPVKAEPTFEQEIDHARAIGFTAGIDAAIWAVEKIPWPKDSFSDDQINFCGGVIIAAIAALKGE